MSGYEFIITTDRTMMTNHHGKEFLGFMTTAPAIGLPEMLWMWIAAPKMKVDKMGRPWQAPYGLRKVEAALIDAGFKAAVIDPRCISKHLKTAKGIFIGHHDYFALGPPSSEWWILTKREPVNAKSFKRFMESRAMREAKKRGVKVVVGGPAAWQWLWAKEYWERWGVDTVVEGEGEKVAVKLAEAICNGDPLPKYLYVPPSEAPKLSEIPTIKLPSVNGLIEITRGCPRGCKFCSVTLKPLRHYTLDMIERELKVNVKYGIVHGILHSEDVLLYGVNNVVPKEEPLFKLHTLVKKYYKTLAWSHVSLAAVKAAEENGRIISRLSEIIMDEHQDYLGVEVGIETGSPKLASKIMPAKSAPYPIEKWPEIVKEAFSIMHENNIVPAATLILGLPGETEDDVIATLELLDRLKPYRSLIATMFFVPMGAFKNKEWFKGIEVSDLHKELMVKVFWHSAYWARDILNKFYMKEKYYLPVKFLINIFIRYSMRKVRSATTR